MPSLSLPPLEACSAAMLLRRALLLFPEVLRPLLQLEANKHLLNTLRWKAVLGPLDQLCTAYVLHNSNLTPQLMCDAAQCVSQTLVFLPNNP